ncbi:MAG: hypothetical protein ACRC4W_00145 [Treponemataceae bacterium]
MSRPKKTSDELNFVQNDPVESCVENIGLERFLQISPQPNGITALLRRNYSTCVKTKENWLLTIEEILNQKIT